MKLMRLLAAVAVALSVSASAAAQSSVTSSDIQRLQDIIYDASRDITQARSRDGALASQLQAELDDARDETIYLKVKLRRNEPIARSEYSDVRDRIENIRSRARGDSAGGYTPPAGSRSEPVTSPSNPGPTPTTGRSQNPNEIPVGTEFDVRLQNPLSSKTAQVEDRFEATTLVDLRDERRHRAVRRLLPRHARARRLPAAVAIRGVVSVRRASRVRHRPHNQRGAGSDAGGEERRQGHKGLLTFVPSVSDAFSGR